MLRAYSQQIKSYLEAFQTEEAVYFLLQSEAIISHGQGQKQPSGEINPWPLTFVRYGVLPSGVFCQMWKQLISKILHAFFFFSNSLSLGEGELAKHRGLYLIKESLQFQKPY